MTNEMILREFMEKVWNQQDFESIETYVDPEYTVHLDTGDPWESKTLNHDEFKERLNYSFGSFPDIHFSIQDAVSDENHVAITWIMTGTNLGIIGELPATGKSIKASGVTIYHFRNQKVCGHSQVFDRGTIVKQLGF